MSNQNHLVEKALEALKKDFVVVGKTRVRSWHAWLVIGLATGIVAGIIFVANQSGEFEKSSAATDACTHYASPSGGGNGSQSSPFQIANFWSVASPGKTLCLLDGVYTGGNSMIAPPNGMSGSSGNPITVRALNDGGAWINGQGSDKPVALTTQHNWWVIQGIDASNSGNGSVVGVSNSSNNVVIRRVVAWESQADNNGVLGAYNLSGPVLFEDTAGFGQGRNIYMITSGANNVTLRRSWGMFEAEAGGITHGPNAVIEGIYNSDGTLVENFVGTWADSVTSLQPYGIVTLGHGGGGSGGGIYGSIGYIKSSASFPGWTGFHISDVVSNFTLKDVVSYTAQSKMPFDLWSSSGNVMQNTTEIGGTASDVGSGWTVSNRVDVDTVGAAPNIWNGAGTSGARVCKQYVNGTLTNNALWPWPMDARIRQALTRAGKNPDAVFGGTGNSVTQQMEQIFGAIPSECRTGGTTVTPAPTVSLTASPTSITSGTASTLSWSSANATSCTASGAWSETKTVSGTQSTGSLTATSTFTLSCTGAGGTTSQSATVNVTAPTAFDFTLSNGGNRSVTQGSSVTNSVTATLSSGTAQSTNFSVSGLPTGATASFSPTACSPNCSTTLTINTLSSTPTGNSTITVTATAGSVIKTSTFILTVAAPTVTTTGSCTHYASPSGGGNGLSQSSPFQISSFWSVAGPGKTLCLLDGTYTGSASMIDPPDGLAGTSGNPITVRALNDGGARIDGQNTLKPVMLNIGNSWFVIEGINANNSGNGSVLGVSNGANNSIIRRVVAWNAQNANNGVMGIYNSSNVTFEDVAAFGTARNVFQITQSADYATLRRVWGIYENDSSLTGPEAVFESMYNSINDRFENVIGTWNQTQAVNPYGIFFIGDEGTGHEILGSTFYVKSTDAFSAGQLVYGNANPGVKIKDVVSYTEQSGKRPFDLGSGGGANIFQNNTEIGGTSSTIGGNWQISNRVDVDTVAQAPNIWNGAGTQGARVCKQYVNGVLTNNPLWPWPMDARIRAALIAAGKNPDTIFGGTGNSVTQQMEQKFGAIPAECRTGGTTVTPAPTVSISASPTSITSGTASTLTWSSANATACTASGAWSGTKATSGSQSTGNLTTSSTFTLSCTGAGGSASQSTTVNVSSLPPPTSSSISAFKTLSPITLDGSLAESVWSLANSVTFSGSNNTVKASTLWDNTNLYFAYDVTDSQLEALNISTGLWQDDSAEIYLDTQNNKSTTMDANDFYFFSNINNIVFPSSITGRTLTKTGGYSMEIKIPWSTISTIPQANKILGLLLANNDRDGGVIKQFDWMNVIGTGSYSQPNLWGSLTLSGTTVGTGSLPGDLNGDRIINSIDFSIMNSKWLTNDSTSDLNKDGIVNSLDFSIMNSNWLKTY